MLTVIGAHSPEFSDKDHTSVFLTVTFAEIGRELRFNAKADDPEQHGRELLQRALSLEFGPITPYEEPEWLNDIPGRNRPNRKRRGFWSNLLHSALSKP